jgi:hypothetical protein
MRRIGLIGLMLATAMAAFGESPAALSVGQTAVKILPERNLTRSSGIPWTATNTVSQGNIIRWSSQFYMAETGGRLGTNAPVHLAGTELNGTVPLRYVTAGPRRGFIAQMQSTGTVYLAVSLFPANGFGVKVSGELSHWSESGDGCPQGAIYGVSPSGQTNLVGGIEW